MKKGLLIFLGIIFVLCAVVAGGTWYVMNKIKTGDLSFLSALSFLNKRASVDLGITFTDADKTSAHEKTDTTAGVLTLESSECKTLHCTSGKAIYIGSQKINVTLTNSEGTALINEWIRLSPNAPFTAAQMKVNSDGSVDFAGIVDMQQVKRYGVAGNIPAETMDIVTKYVGAMGDSFPLNASGTLTIKNNNVSANFSKVQIGIIPVPSSILSDYKGDINSFVEDRLKVVSNINIEELSFADGKTTFKGTLPKTIYYVK